MKGTCKIDNSWLEVSPVNFVPINPLMFLYFYKLFMLFLSVHSNAILQEELGGMKCIFSDLSLC